MANASSSRSFRAETRAGTVGFCVGTGRCGTTLFSELCRREPNVGSFHERQRLGATFHMYCQWYGIPIDHEGFLAERQELIDADLSQHHHSIEANALLSHSILELFNRFDAKFLLLIRHPAETVASFAVRGWFANTPARDRVDLPPTFRGGSLGDEKARHFLGRNIPTGAEFHRWASLTQIGRIAWFWNARNQAILNQFELLPPSHRRVQTIEDLDIASFRSITEFFGWTSEIPEDDFNQLANSRLNTGPAPPRRITQWRADEIREFSAEVEPVASAIGYDIAHRP